MKTDRFDEEFRRKLLELPTDTNPGEVDHIHDFVRANKPVLPGPGWGRLLFYGGSSLLLIGSLSYNLIQNYRTTHLQSSLDSLTHQSISKLTIGEVVRHDTIYITQSGNSEADKSLALPQLASEAPQRQTNPVLAPQVAQVHQPETKATLVIEKPNSPTSDNDSTIPTQLSGDPTRRQSSSQPVDELTGAVTSLPIASSGRLATEKSSLTEGKDSVTKWPTYKAELLERSAANAPLASGNRLRSQSRNSVGQLIAAKAKNELLATQSTRQQRQQTLANQSAAGTPPVNTEVTTPNESIAGPNRQLIAIEPLMIRQAIKSSNQLATLRPIGPLMIVKNGAPAQATRKSWQLTLPHLSVSKGAQYRIGGELMAGDNDQLGGALLGELMINRHWSIQAGVRILNRQGFHYQDERDFDGHRDDDFRQRYASQVPLTSTIEDINQVSLVAQVPVQIAYHYPLNQQWRLRLGIGTDLDLWVRSTTNYKYQQTSRFFERGLTRMETPARIINNLTLTPSVEWYWKKWLFRAGPFISPQFRSVSYKPEDLSWGAHAQVFYRVGK